MSKQKSSIFLIYLLLNVLSINVELKALKINKLNKLQSKSLKSSTKIKTKRVFGFTNLDDHLDIWVKCSNEFETCKFSGGNRIVRYGNSPNYVYGEFTDTVSCNSNQFGVVGDFNPNKSNFMIIVYLYIGIYYW